MKTQYLLFFIFILFIWSACQPGKDAVNEFDISGPNQKLWYTSPASQWTEALPIGNGRMGAMIFGDPYTERIQLNEESIWAGAPINDNNPLALENLPKIRQLLFEGKNDEALRLAEKALLATPFEIRSYQPLMDLQMKFDHREVSDYRRELNLMNGLHTTTYRTPLGSMHYQAFASAPDDVIVIYLRAEGKQKINVDLSLDREKDAKFYTSGDNILVMEGQIIDEELPAKGPGGAHLKFAAMVKVFPDGGASEALDKSIRVKDAQNLMILITGASDYDAENLTFNREVNPLGRCHAIIENAADKTYTLLKSSHIDDHYAFMGRTELVIGNEDHEHLTTVQRLENVKSGLNDDGLISLFFQYGRYLLLGSSRAPGQLPANLQGIWNHHMTAPWNSDYHANINLQMNYWHAEVANLSETLEPLYHFVRRNAVPGRVTAREMYGTSGWTFHHVLDIYGRTGLHDGIQWGTFPMGGPWMTFPVWRHFEFGQDKTYLKNIAWPMLKGSAEFVLDFLIESPDGYLVSSPSYSPENSYVDPKTSKEHRLTYGPYMDTQIARELFHYCLSAIEILGDENGLQQRIQMALEKLPPNRIGADGTLMEWIQDYEEYEPGHRHMSHLLALHPGGQITSDEAELFEAAAKTIEKRLAHGGGHTGWSRAWVINFYARLLNGNEAYHHLLALLQKSTHDNLFGDHPPFQIDGNFGGAAGVAEILLQSHAGCIHLLPALPEAWPTGKVKGLRARGNFEISMEWKDGKLLYADVNAPVGGKATFCYGDKKQEFNISRGETVRFNP
ncbi:MAG: glycoside hydrolase family 95 protein [Cyclobacteriaceae bacterium]|nr:glycoside hydrolase family 95 protein [Cyclobacteriaceae bacterium]